MPRKSAGSLEEQRERIKRRYLRGPKATRTLTSESKLTVSERFVKQELACHLRAAGFSLSYIAEAVGMSEPAIDLWFQDEELALYARVEKIHDDFTMGAVTLGQTYLMEIMEGLMELFRTSDDKTAKEIGFEFLDRFGITKVNKSQSVVEQTSVQRVEVLDSTGLLEKAKNAPPHVQAEMAEAMEKLVALGSEYADIPDEPEADDA